MIDIEWKDETSYNRMDTVRIPWVLKANLGEVDITVHRFIGLESWFLSSKYLSLKNLTLDSKDLEDAKVEALKVSLDILNIKSLEIKHAVEAIKKNIRIEGDNHNE